MANWKCAVLCMIPTKLGAVLFIALVAFGFVLDSFLFCIIFNLYAIKVCARGYKKTYFANQLLSCC